MKILAPLLVVVSALTINSIPVARAQGQDGADEADQVGVTSETFFNDESLSKNGRWINVEKYGSCWQPNGRSADWRPYTRGTFRHNEDGGWIWVSDPTEEAWGWATFHYGRWFKVEGIGCGWAWVPGTEWSGAWVSWRNGQSPECTCVGWAPLPPETTCQLNVGVNRAVERTVDIGPDYYTFVHVRDLGSDNYERCGCVLERRRYVNIFEHTVNITNISFTAGRRVRVYCGGPELTWCNNEIRRSGGREITAIQINLFSDPGMRRGGHGHGGDPNTLTFFAPQVRFSFTGSAKVGPKITMNVPATKVDHGWKNVDPKTETTLKTKIADQTKGVTDTKATLPNDLTVGAMKYDKDNTTGTVTGQKLIFDKDGKPLNDAAKNATNAANAGDPTKTGAGTTGNAGSTNPTLPGAPTGLKVDGVNGNAGNAGNTGNTGNTGTGNTGTGITAPNATTLTNQQAENLKNQVAQQGNAGNAVNLNDKTLQLQKLNPADGTGNAANVDWKAGVKGDGNDKLPTDPAVLNALNADAAKQGVPPEKLFNQFATQVTATNANSKALNNPNNQQFKELADAANKNAQTAANDLNNAAQNQGKTGTGAGGGTAGATNPTLAGAPTGLKVDGLKTADGVPVIDQRQGATLDQTQTALKNAGVTTDGKQTGAAGTGAAGTAGATGITAAKDPVLTDAQKNMIGGNAANVGNAGAAGNTLKTADGVPVVDQRQGATIDQTQNALKNAGVATDGTKTGTTGAAGNAVGGTQTTMTDADRAAAAKFQKQFDDQIAAGNAIDPAKAGLLDKTGTAGATGTLDPTQGRTKTPENKTTGLNPDHPPGDENVEGLKWKQGMDAANAAKNTGATGTTGNAATGNATGLHPGRKITAGAIKRGADPTEFQGNTGKTNNATGLKSTGGSATGGDVPPPPKVPPPVTKVIRSQDTNTNTDTTGQIGDAASTTTGSQNQGFKKQTKSTGNKSKNKSSSSTGGSNTQGNGTDGSASNSGGGKHNKAQKTQTANRVNANATGNGTEGSTSTGGGKHKQKAQRNANETKQNTEGQTQGNGGKKNKKNQATPDATIPPP